MTPTSDWNATGNLTQAPTDGATRVPTDDVGPALCLTHDVDRPYKTYQAVYDALRDRSLDPLSVLVGDENPYWQFGAIRSLESSLGVRSAFYFLDEPSLLAAGTPAEWVAPWRWIEHFGRYDPTAPELAAAIRELDRDGWEVGLHGSLRSFDDRERLVAEKHTLEAVLGGEVTGGRQHHLRLAPDTWDHHRDVGLRYDASLGSATEYGFHAGHHPLRPFDDGFVVFPLTVMEVALPDPGEAFDRAREACRRLVDEAVRENAVMTALWHPRYFAESEFPGYRRLYAWLVEHALDRGLWVGPPGDLYDRLDLGVEGGT